MMKEVVKLNQKADLGRNDVLVETAAAPLGKKGQLRVVDDAV
jgi:hypothetical protein